MDLSTIASTLVGILIALAAGYLGYLEWRKASLSEKVAIIERIVLAIEQTNPGEKLGEKRLALVLDRLAYLFPNTDAAELRELVEATVARINLAKQGQGPSRVLPRGYFTD